MERIGIIGAMEEEVSQLVDHMEQKQIVNATGMVFYQGRLMNKEVVIVRSGIGKINAAICAQSLINLFKVDALINTGVAGSLNNEINITDIVLSTDSLQHDVDATEFGYELGVIPRMETSVFPADEVLLREAKKVCEKELKEVGVFCGRVVSGDQFIASKEKKDWLIENFHADCTEMEGAAIAQVAYLNQVPYLVIRAISDKADQSAQMSYDEFEHIAIGNTVKLLLGLVKAL